jgi:protein tyrosine phosphatase (PTP) superfamily phosphohydrolase (DUF442 family)
MTFGIYQYHPVSELLATAGQPTEGQLASIASEGFEVIVNLALHDEPRYSLHDEAGLVRSLGMEYIHIPVAFDAPTQADLLAFFAAMNRHQNQKMLVHCAANIRVSTFVGLYNAIEKGEPVERAFALMKTIWQPNPVWESFISSMLRQHS